MALLLVGCSASAPPPVTQPAPDVCGPSRLLRARAKLQFAAGHARHASALIACADKHCAGEASSSTDLRKKTSDALGRARKPDLGEALATDNAEAAADILERLGLGVPSTHQVHVTTGAIGVGAARVVLGSEQQLAVVYDSKTWAPRVVIPATSFALSPDGAQLAVTTANDVRLYDPLTAASTPFAAGTLTFSPDSQRLAIASDSAVSIVSLATRTVERTIPAKGTEAVQFVGKTLLLRTETTLDVIDLGTGKNVLSRASVLDAVVTEDQKRLAWIGSFEGGKLDVAFVDLAHFATVHSVRVPFASTSAPKLAMRDDGRTLVVSDGQQLLVVDAKTSFGRTLPKRVGGAFGVSSLYFDRDQRRVCGFFVREGETCGWDLTTNAVIEGHPFVARRRHIELRMKGLGAPQATVLASVSSANARIKNGALAADDQTFAVVEQEGPRLFVVLYDLAQKKVLGRVAIDGELHGMLSLDAVGDVFVLLLGERAHVVDPKSRAVIGVVDSQWIPVVAGDSLIFSGRPDANSLTALSRATKQQKTIKLDTELCSVGPHVLPASACDGPVACP